VRAAAFHRRRGHAVLELVGQLGQAALGAEVGLALPRIGIDDEVEPARQVVDHRQLFALQQHDVGRVEPAGQLRFRELGFDVAHRVVAEVAGQAAAEARQARPQRHLEALLVGGDEVERVALMCLDDLAVGHDLAVKAGRPQQRVGRQADERIASEALAAHHRFEQEAVLAAA